MKKIILSLILFLLIPFSIFGEVYEFDRYVSGEYFDTYSIDDADLVIDLQDFTTYCDLFYISPIDGYDFKTASQNTGDNHWSSFYKEVTVVPKNDMFLNRFYFNTHDNWQSFNFLFELRDTKLVCEEFLLYNYNYRDYFKMNCESVLDSKNIVMYYQGETPAIDGTINTEHMYIHNGNNTQIRFSECSLIKADTLILEQSRQNNVVINGHLIVEHLESEANIGLYYDDATITIGEVPSNLKIFGGETTTINLCLNPSESADNLGYFKGMILFNTDPETGWFEKSPSMEGDVNYNDNSSDYWVWKNSNIVPEELPVYDDYQSCIVEYINITQGIVESDEIDIKPIVKTKSSQEYNILGQKLNSVNDSKIMIEYFLGKQTKK